MKLSRFIPVALLVALFSCKKNDDKPATSKPVYYPATINIGDAENTLKYTFNYKEDGTLSTITGTSSFSDVSDTLHFVRNANGDCIKVTSKSGADSIGYRGNTVIIYAPDNYGFYTDSTLFTVNNLGDVILFGSKDTVRTESSKSLYYSEFTLVNGNPETITTYDYYIATGDTQGSTSSNVLTYTYDDKQNGLQTLLRAEPVVLYYMKNVISYISLGQNNLTGMKQSGFTLSFTNTYDDVTGYLSTQSTSVENITLKLAYTYIKIK